MGNEYDISKLQIANIAKIDISKFEIPKIDTSALVNISAGLQSAHRELDGIEEAMQAEFMRKEEARQAAIETAENTSEMKSDLKTIIKNQNDYIAILKEQNEYMKRVLSDLLGSSENSSVIQKEILKIMQESKPTDGLVADKGFDVAIQLVLNSIKIYLQSKGIFFSEIPLSSKTGYVDYMRSEE